MKKRIMSIIAAATVMTCVSPLCATAIYTERMTKQDHTDYMRVDYLSDEKKDIYIYNGSDATKLYEKYPYVRSAIAEVNRHDRIYFNAVNDDTETKTDSTVQTTNKVTDELNLLLKDFVTENGDGIRAHISFYDKEFGYYLEPVNNSKEDELLEITPNDARRIKEFLAQSNFATDVFYSTDVCSPANGSIDFNCYYLPDIRNKTKEEKAEMNTVLKQQIDELAAEKGYDISLSGDYEAISIVPNVDMSFEEMFALSEQICTNIEGIHVSQMYQCTISESFGGIDLMNAVDGDANCDSERDMSDVVLIMQSLANPNKYQLSAQGTFNADMDGNGLTVGDAQALQKILLGL